MALLRASSATEEELGTTVIAIDKDKNSQYAVKWAVDNILSKSPYCVLVHVRSQSLHPLDVDAGSKEGRPPTESELQQFFLPYRGFCARKGIEAKEVVLHDIDVPSALIDYISNNSISNVVVGTSNRSPLTRKFRNAEVSSSLLKSAPESCTVYVISKGKVQTIRPASRTPSTATAGSPSSAANPAQRSQRGLNLPPENQESEDINRTSYNRGGRRRSGERLSYDRSSDFLQMTTHYNLKNVNLVNSPRPSLESSTSGNSSQRNSDFSGTLSFRSGDMSSESLESAITLESPRSPSTQTAGSLEAEMRRLRLELRQTMEMYNSACKEAVVAKERTRELQKWMTAEERKLEEAKLAEEAALALAEVERHKTKAAVEAAQMAQRLAEMEMQKRKNVEMKAKQEAEERKKSLGSLAQSNFRYRRYTIEEIEVATDHFRGSLKIGEGGYGPVYKGVLEHTAVAIKVLRPDISQGQRQFQQEVEVLSCIRHPNMVLLVGACPEYGCLVYEYMDNGSLEDRLFQKDNTPSLPWPLRFKIASEIATALLFLHQTKPEPLVHRDLKPANILLDRNFVSKISDVGLARLVPPSVADSVTQYHMTTAAGTFCYIDPEYQQTGLLGVKSDIYSLGVMLLQIITAKPPMGLSHLVEESIEKGTFSEILDQTVPDWPVQEALSLAKLALKCCELRKRDRPDLGTILLPELNRLKDLDEFLSGSSNSPTYEERPYSSVPLIEQINQRWLTLMTYQSLTSAIWQK